MTLETAAWVGRQEGSNELTPMMPAALASLFSRSSQDRIHPARRRGRISHINAPLPHGRSLRSSAAGRDLPGGLPRSTAPLARGPGQWRADDKDYRI